MLLSYMSKCIQLPRFFCAFINKQDRLRHLKESSFTKLSDNCDMKV